MVIVVIVGSVRGIVIVEIKNTTKARQREENESALRLNKNFNTNIRFFCFFFLFYYTADTVVGFGETGRGARLSEGVRGEAEGIGSLSRAKEKGEVTVFAGDSL